MYLRTPLVLADDIIMYLKSNKNKLGLDQHMSEILMSTQHDLDNIIILLRPLSPSHKDGISLNQ